MTRRWVVERSVFRVGLVVALAAASAVAFDDPAGAEHCQAGTALPDVALLTEADDCYDGGAGGDMVLGLEGDDVLKGGEGGDRLDGGPGDDILIGGPGFDVLNGGEGYDVCVDVAGGDGGNTVECESSSLDGTRTFPSDPCIQGGTQGINLWNGRGSEDDCYRGRAANDVAVGGDGDDALFGGPGDDYIFGGPGDDVVAGEDDDDVLFGGTGRDKLIGGEGFDVCFDDPSEEGTADCEMVVPFSGSDLIGLPAIARRGTG